MLIELSKKTGYHHGDLRHALVEASRILILRHRLNGFKISDACAMAGVSTAAPYRHFKDREELLSAVASQGFWQMGQSLKAAKEQHPQGSHAAMQAIGRAYLAYAEENGPIFELLWSRPADALDITPEGSPYPENFMLVMKALEDFCVKHKCDNVDLLRTTISFWSLLHGMASLVFGGNLRTIAPDLDIYELADQSIHRLLDGIISDHGRRFGLTGWVR